MFFKNIINRKNKLEINNNIEKNIVYRRTILLENYKKKEIYSIAFGSNNVAIGYYTVSYGGYSFSL